MTPEPPRPPLLTAAVVLHAVSSLLALGVSAAVALGGGVGVAVAASEARRDEEVVLVVVLAVLVAGVACLFALYALVGLVVSWQAARMRRPWLWALLVLSLIGASTNPCGLAFAAITALGTLQALERTGSVGRT